jgi:hypothetical protein
LLLKIPEVWILAILNAPKFPIGIKNHETIFIKYYRKLGVYQNWFGIFSIFVQFSRISLVLAEKEKEKNQQNWAETGPSRPINRQKRARAVGFAETPPSV